MPAKSDQGIFEVCGVSDLASLKRWDEAVETTEIVLISAVGIRMISDLLRLWKQYFGDTPMQI
ncbi:hypothetical protein FXB42_07495 [Acetobacterium wieringae]|uniref:Uncharacterized protein n=1 Tax=Acetobacterium wieringae TaxID=52694 RepID=A0A5D0WNZ7_9FIRM|nr:hypothetical protein FXB42_07495 [Acetobacterium wieringae]